jgi:hypothetical protein
MTRHKRMKNLTGVLTCALIFFGTQLVRSQADAISSVTASSVLSRERPAGQNFRLLAPMASFAGVTRAELLKNALLARILADKDTLLDKDCTKRPMITNPAGLFLLPGDVGKDLTCTLPANTALLIDFTGTICQEYKGKKASPECVKERLAVFTEYGVSIDGLSLGAGRFAAVSNQFDVETKDGNAFKLEAGSWRLRAGGWPMIVTNLTPGTHVIRGHYKVGDTNRQKINVTVVIK